MKKIYCDLCGKEILYISELNKLILPMSEDVKKVRGSIYNSVLVKNKITVAKKVDICNVCMDKIKIFIDNINWMI